MVRQRQGGLRPKRVSRPAAWQFPPPIAPGETSPNSRRGYLDTGLDRKGAASVRKIRETPRSWPGTKVEPPDANAWGRRRRTWLVRPRLPTAAGAALRRAAENPNPTPTP